MTADPRLHLQFERLHARLGEYGSQTLYEYLGARQGATPHEIKFKFWENVRKYHRYSPMRDDIPDAEKRFDLANDSYQILSDADKRAAYDAWLKVGGGQAQSQGDAASLSGTKQNEPSQTHFDVSDADLEKRVADWWADSNLPTAGLQRGLNPNEYWRLDEFMNRYSNHIIKDFNTYAEGIVGRMEKKANRTIKEILEIFGRGS